MPKTRVFADTNVILESFRTGCWPVISNHFAIETVEKCVEETLTGNPDDPRHIKVPSAELKKGLAGNHPVTRKDIAALVLSQPSCAMLDDGEMHLFAWLLANNILPSLENLITTADKAALVATNDLGWLKSTISLEGLAKRAGVARDKLCSLNRQYREEWLSQVRTKIRMGIYP